MFRALSWSALYSTIYEDVLVAARINIERRCIEYLKINDKKRKILSRDKRDVYSFKLVVEYTSCEDIFLDFYIGSVWCDRHDINKKLTISRIFLRSRDCLFVYVESETEPYLITEFLSKFKPTT